MMQWLNQNAGAVQAIMAIILGVLTPVLIGVTWWYAKLTRRMVLAQEQQLAASFHPDIEMTLIHRFQGKGSSFGVQSESFSGTIVVTNKGMLPLKVVSAAMKLVYDKNAFPDQTTTMDARQRVVSPGKTAQFTLNLDVPLGGSTAEYEQLAQIHCSDLAGVSKHTFSISHRDEGVVNQFAGFQPI
jgi:hypothetical protein